MFFGWVGGGREPALTETVSHGFVPQILAIAPSDRTLAAAGVIELAREALGALLQRMTEQVQKIVTKSTERCNSTNKTDRTQLPYGRASRAHDRGASSCDANISAHVPGALSSLP